MTLCGDPHGGPALASWRGQHLLSPMALVAEQRHLRILIPTLWNVLALTAQPRALGLLSNRGGLGA